MLDPSTVISHFSSMMIGSDDETLVHTSDSDLSNRSADSESSSSPDSEGESGSDGSYSSESEAELRPSAAGPSLAATRIQRRMYPRLESYSGMSLSDM